MTSEEKSELKAQLDQYVENIRDGLNKATDNLWKYLRTANDVCLNAESARSED